MKINKGEVLTAQQLMADPLFAGIPPKFLLWQEGLAVRLRTKPGDVLCREGEPGNTAFLIKSGRVVITVKKEPNLRIERGPEDFIVGEMACLSGKPRTAQISVIEAGEIWEIRRNVLDRLMRSPAQRERFDRIYRRHALDVVLRETRLFQVLSEPDYKRCADFLREKLTFIRVSPGRPIFAQGDSSHHFFFVRLGHVSVEIKKRGRAPNLIYRGPGTAIGEIGLLALSPSDAGRTPDEVEAGVIAALNDPTMPPTAALPSGQRTATCTALDHVELARVDRADFLGLLKTFPVLRRRLIELALERLRQDDDDRPAMRQYMEQGLYQGQSLLVLDLNKCTRCDECTRACRDQHGTQSHGIPITRLLRQGLHFGNFLVATSCRSCADAYCMIGCPVDAIHRGKHQQIVIEDHCIGCGLCANNCPFGNIAMIPNERDKMQRPDPDHPGKTELVAQMKASTCDLCDADGEREVPKPRCVHACPHDAAHRMSGGELFREITGRSSER
ncbi:MAG TPA: cyclic nucleotide-binding domain-containing protein [Tepidisphaeraceae bacterium]|nr:cyclic nucleotide-binding domain-containing protein [Tepidisphaeraceae bacterium]